MTNQKIYNILENNEKYITYCLGIIENIDGPVDCENFFSYNVGDKKHLDLIKSWQLKKVKYHEALIKTVKEINKQYLTKLNKGGNND